MQRHPVITKDGSHTIAVPDLNVTYHSIHGAIQESMHVFIDAGLHEIMKQNPPPGTIAIFEMGFGTGLNALLTWMEAESFKRRVYYYSIELHPLSVEEVRQLNYTARLNHANLEQIFNLLHSVNWEVEVPVTEYFLLHKTKSNLLDLSTLKQFDLIYYDAFAPNAQPELWTQDVFEKLFAIMAPGGILVTYCSKGDVRRAMYAAGFIVEKIQGPQGKREMLRGKKRES
jgi:tRNA U34 5-methylaminomethyl-2-thiouridine-forming methyltransferase MnmC